MPSQRWLHIIPVSFIMYTIAFIDRTNVSLALPSMSRDLHMNPTQAGGAAGIFFWGYVALQIPGGHLAQRWSAKRFVSILLVVWGLCSVCCGLVQTYREFWVMRLLLGVAEGGVWPAVLVLLSHWFPRGERARANAYWMLCLPIAVIVSSPLSGWILGHWNWRVLLIAEGALPFVWLIIWWTFIDDYPQEARWISSEERNYLETTLLEESRELGLLKQDPLAEPEPALRSLLKFGHTLLNPVVLVMIGIYLMQNTGNYGFLFWLPTVLGNARKMSSLSVGTLFAVPYIVTAIGMVVLSRRCLYACLHPADRPLPGVGFCGNLHGRCRILWNPGSFLGDSNRDSSALDFRIRDGIDQCSGQLGRVFRPAGCGVCLSSHGRLSVRLRRTLSGIPDGLRGDSSSALAAHRS